MKKLLGILLAVLMLAGCSWVKPTENNYAPESSLTVWTCLEEAIYGPMVKEFEERTGIWVTVRSGSVSELMADIPDGGCDLIVGCDIAWLEANKDLFQAPELGMEIMRTPRCPVSEKWVTLSLNPVVLVYNPQLVRRNPPTDWDDLLASEWKHQIAFPDPEDSDFSSVVLQILLGQNPKEASARIFSRFADNLDVLALTDAEAYTQVINGSYFLAALPEDMIQRKIADGASLAVVYPKSGVYMSADGGAIPENAENPESAREFLRFLLSSYAQSYNQKYNRRGSVLAELANIPRNTLFPNPEKIGKNLPMVLEQWHRIWRGRV